MEKIKQKQISEKRLDYINQVLKRCERLKILNESENMENAKKEDVELIQDLRKLGILKAPNNG
jgi:predicted ABC-type ATPase